MNCLICKSNHLARIEVTKIHRQGYRCDACGFLFLWPQPSFQEITDIYQDSYYKSWGIDSDAENSVTAELKKGTARRYMHKIAKFKRTGSLVDIGCAFGYFMEIANTFGFDVYGVELSSFSSSIALKKFPSKVFCGTLEHAKYYSHIFDVVTLFDVIEHIPDPVSFMKEIRRVIKTGGIVALTTPDTGSISYRLLGLGGWFHWKLEHLSYFNISSIKELAKQAGFSVVHKEKAYKTMSMAYLLHQLTIFPHPIFSPVLRIITAVLPRFLVHKMFTIAGGEMFVILKADSYEV